MSIFSDAGSVMTVVSLITFIGILWWTFGFKHGADFDTAARLPFADEIEDAAAHRISPPALQGILQDSERHHG